VSHVNHAHNRFNVVTAGKNRQLHKLLAIIARVISHAHDIRLHMVTG